MEIDERNDLRGYLPFQMLRLAATPLLLAVPALVGQGRAGLALTATVLLLLDLVDCGLARVAAHAGVLARTGRRACSDSSWYQCGDKVIDQVQYAAALCLVWSWPAPALSPHRRMLLLAAWLWRSVGVALFVRSGAAKASLWLSVFPDLFKELLVLWAVFPSAGAAAISAVVVAKVAFEVVKGRYVLPDKRPRAEN